MYFYNMVLFTSFSFNNWNSLKVTRDDLFWLLKHWICLIEDFQLILKQMWSNGEDPFVRSSIDCSPLRLIYKIRFLLFQIFLDFNWFQAAKGKGVYCHVKEMRKRKGKRERRSKKRRSNIRLITLKNEYLKKYIFCHFLLLITCSFNHLKTLIIYFIVFPSSLFQIRNLFLTKLPVWYLFPTYFFTYCIKKYFSCKYIIFKNIIFKKN